MDETEALVNQAYSDLVGISGEVIWHACVFLPFADLVDVTRLWSSCCDSLAVAQHDADGKTKRTHCHFMIINPFKKKNSFQRQLHRELGDNLPANSHWFAEKVMKGEFKGEKYSRQYLLKYILKGSVARLKFNKNISPAQVEAAVSEWVEPVLGNDTQSKTSKAETHYKVLTEIYKDALSKHPDWFNTNYRATVSFFDRELDLERVEILDHHRYFIFMCNTLHKKHIRTSEHELERMYVTLMRMTEGGVEHLFFRISKKLNLQ